MFEEVNHELATDVTSVADRNKMAMPHNMFEKDIAERLGVKIDDLPPYIGMQGRTVEYYSEKLEYLPRQIAERQAEDEEDLPELEKELRRMQRIAIGKN